MQLFSGQLVSDGKEPIPVKGFVYRRTLTEERTGFETHEFLGVMMAESFRHAGFWDWELETDIGFKAFIQIMMVRHRFQGQLYVMEYGSVGSPIALPSDGSLGVL